LALFHGATKGASGYRRSEPDPPHTALAWLARGSTPTPDLDLDLDLNRSTWGRSPLYHPGLGSWVSGL
jgi:hypothetical protein